jgi:hypothetical protein
MKYAVGMGSDVRIYTPSFIKNDSGIQKSQKWTNGRTDIQTQRHTKSMEIV